MTQIVEPISAEEREHLRRFPAPQFLRGTIFAYEAALQAAEAKIAELRQNNRLNELGWDMSLTSIDSWQARAEAAEAKIRELSEALTKIEELTSDWSEPPSNELNLRHGRLNAIHSIARAALSPNRGQDQNGG